MSGKKLTIALMDPPYESANTTTAFRIIEAALKKGITA
jgi:tRNA 2-thiouridine synthesizing protein D